MQQESPHYVRSSFLRSIHQSNLQQRAKQILQQQSQYIYIDQITDNFSKPIRLKTESDITQTSSTYIKTTKLKKPLLTYSSQKISQISKRLAMPKNPVDKQNRFRRGGNRKMVGIGKEDGRRLFGLPSIAGMKTQELKVEIGTPGIIEGNEKVFLKLIEKRNKSSKIEELIEKLEGIKKSNQKKSIQKLPFIFIQSMNNQTK